MGKPSDIKDEILEQIWMDLEQGKATVQKLVNNRGLDIQADILKKMEDEDFFRITADEIILTEKGRKKAESLIRAHRLAERLFTDVLEIREEFLESNACSFEHILSPELCTAICTLLGHPTECPHGSPIPPGECCRNNLKEVSRVVFPLNTLKAGAAGKILYITTTVHSRLDQLMNLGITPGNFIKVHQTHPAFIVQVGETDIALDSGICREIFVRQVNAS
jgi:DtxR family Mn-dependent transcriptional regulator